MNEDSKPPAPERVIVRNEEELMAKLEESEKDIAEGRTVPADAVYSILDKVMDKYNDALAELAK